MPTPLKSTLSVDDINNNHQEWTRLGEWLVKKTMIKKKLLCLSAEKPTDLKVKTARAGLVLDGLRCQTNGMKAEADAHITITAATSGEWTYFHLTLSGGEGKSAYFKLQENNQEDFEVTKTTDTVIDGKKKAVSKSQYYWSNPPGEVAKDLSLIIAGLLTRRFEHGEAPPR